MSNRPSSNLASGASASPAPVNGVFATTTISAPVSTVSVSISIVIVAGRYVTIALSMPRSES